MKSFKIMAFVMMLLALATSCKDNKNQGQHGNVTSDLLENIVKEWKLTEFGGLEQEFDVYIDFNEDGSFEMYQRVYTYNYLLYTGTYNISDDIITGSYADGENWKCGYKGSVSEDGNTLTLSSQEDHSVVSVYTATTIPEDVKAEASETRSADAERFL